MNEHKFGNTEQQLPHHVIPPYTKEGLAPWDMEFQGQWEMDRDLIGEFIATQDGGEYESNNNNLVQLNRNFSRELADKYDGHLKVIVNFFKNIH